MKTIRRVPDAADFGRVPPPLYPLVEEDSGRLSRGNIATLVVFFVFLALVVVGNLVHLPYAIMSPGPTVNTLGEVPGDKPGKALISVDGLKTYPADGTLTFTTVSVLGGPGYPVDAFDVLGAWVDPAKDVFPVEDVFDPQVSEEQVAEENAIEMEGSQEEATAVALRALGKSVPTHVAIADVLDTSKAKERLRPGDRLVRVNDTQVTTTDSVRDALQQVRPGAPVVIELTRGGKPVSVEVPTTEGQSGRTALGVLLSLDHDFPAKVTINAGEVGGPSAGLMFALGIYDKLTPGSLTGDHAIAGTGTIDDAGNVGPIGGIKQKLAGARAGGSDYFLAPSGNCPEILGNVPAGLEVLKVTSFTDARAAVEGIAAGKTSSLPRCS